ncbi:hypothetical protein AMATHDRAFT_139589 [Amanita thiersii Skay4041]|uniref:AB hydrolase-1 domain-containing protein n=1 Tax=Amanita thiersii Skay4041 TaxID=703135 RepID=A0A2A9NW29_9AGAR|nr:hypothetical protein AMATHDRAFT_139589 [Amanita thiersii Skay4041]
MIHVEDKRLTLPDARILAYADNGNTSSSIVVLYLHGVFTVGDASRLSPALLEKNVHFVAPTLPGWGASSPIPDVSSYPKTFAADITVLLNYLHPQQQNLKLYICAHCFGTVVAQMLCNLSYDVFPLGHRISACILVSPYSPPHCHFAYARSMSWQPYVLAGPPARYVPFNILPRLFRLIISLRVQSRPATDAVVQKYLFDGLSEEETESLLKWKERHGVEEGQFEKEIVRNAIKSVALTWRGFLDMPTIYHSNYGWRPPNFEDRPSAPYFYIVCAQDDPIIPAAMAQWLAKEYGTMVHFTILNGSRLSALIHLDEVWENVFNDHP